MTRKILGIAIAVLAMQGLSGCGSDRQGAAQAPPPPAAAAVPTAQDYGIPDSKHRFEIQNALIAQKSQRKRQPRENCMSVTGR